MSEHHLTSKHNSARSSQALFERKKGMLICSLNLPSLLKHKPEIEVLLHDISIDVLALHVNETNLDPNILKCNTDIDGYHHERFDRN